MKFDTGFNYYARFARLVRDRGGKEGERGRGRGEGGEEGYIDVEFDQLGDTWTEFEDD